MGVRSLQNHIGHLGCKPFPAVAPPRLIWKLPPLSLQALLLLRAKWALETADVGSYPTLLIYHMLRQLPAKGTPGVIPGLLGSEPWSLHLGLQHRNNPPLLRLPAIAHILPLQELLALKFLSWGSIGSTSSVWHNWRTNVALCCSLTCNLSMSGCWSLWGRNSETGLVMQARDP